MDDCSQHVHNGAKKALMYFVINPNIVF